MKVTKVDILFFINLYLVNVEPLAYKEQVYITLFFFFYLRVLAELVLAVNLHFTNRGSNPLLPKLQIF